VEQACGRGPHDIRASNKAVDPGRAHSLRAGFQDARPDSGAGAGPAVPDAERAAVYVSWTWRLVKRLGQMAGVAQAAALTPHSLRSTAITELLDAGVSLRDVQDFARHRDPRTSRRYDKQRGNLDRSGSYVLATRYGQRANSGPAAR